MSRDRDPLLELLANADPCPPSTPVPTVDLESVRQRAFIESMERVAPGPAHRKRRAQLVVATVLLLAAITAAGILVLRDRPTTQLTLLNEQLDSRLVHALEFAPPQQAEFLADGFVTDEELDAAIGATERCARDGGVDDIEIVRSARGVTIWSVGQSSATGPADSPTLQRCSAEHLDWVAWWWGIHTAQNPDLIVFLHPDTEQTRIDAVRLALEQRHDVTILRFIDQTAAYAEFRELFARNADMLAAVNPTAMPTSFQLRFVGDAELIQVTTNEIEQLPGVREVVTPNAPPR